MSLTPTNHVHGVLHIIVDATGNNSLHTFLILFTDLNWGGGGGELPRMGLQVPFTPYHLVGYFS